MLTVSYPRSPRHVSTAKITMQEQVLRAMLGHPSPLLGWPDHEEDEQPANESTTSNSPHQKRRPAPATATPKPFRSTSLLTSSLSDAEACAIDSLVHHGGYVAHLRDFVEREALVDTSSSSIYLRAIARCIGTWLQRYEDQLLSIHRDLRQDPCLGLEYIRSQAMGYWGWTSHVSQLVEWLEERRSPPSTISCAIIDEIDQRMTSCPDDCGQRALLAILEAAQTVLWNQCMRWLCHGKLSDPSDEFFIVYDEVNGTETVQGSETAAPVSIVETRIPYASISFSLANRMLFVGNAVRLIRLYGDAENAGEGDACSSSGSALLLSPPIWPTSADREKKPMKLELERKVDSAHLDASSSLCKMFRDKFHLRHHAQNLRRLFLHGDGLFYSELLRECDAGDIWATVAEHATCNTVDSSIEENEWNILGGERMFQNHIVRRVCSRLDGDGINNESSAFWEASSFSIRVERGLGCNLSGQNLVKEILESAQRDVLHLPHTHAVRVVLSEAHERAISAISWADGDVPSSTRAGSGNDQASLTTVLSCEYCLPPVLKSVLSDEVIEASYNSFFRRFFAIHRASFELQKCWSMLLRENIATSTRSEMVAINQLRSKMHFYIHNLQIYFQEIVAESFHHLEVAFQDSMDYEEVIEAHSRFLGTMRRGFFLDDQSFNESFGAILALVHWFASVIAVAGVAAEADLSKIVSRNVVSCISERFDLESKNLFQLLSGNPDAVGLCLRLGFNGHYK